jgi:hypothetical protein
MNTRYATISKLAIITVSLFLIQGCASKVPISMGMNQLKGQTTVYNSGKPMIVSKKAVTVAATYNRQLTY